MTFIPYTDKIEVRPLKKEGILDRMDENFMEAGEVVAIGGSVQSVAVGDTIFFLAHGCWKTAEVDGVEHWVVPDTSEYILGKLAPDVAEVDV